MTACLHLLLSFLSKIIHLVTNGTTPFPRKVTNSPLGFSADNDSLNAHACLRCIPHVPQT